jgi:hypothetical protein
MNEVHKIAVFGKDVHILYVAEMAQNFRLLLLVLQFGAVLGTRDYNM